MDCLGVIQCRMASSRLPGKALLPLAGRPLLEWVVLRTRRARALSRLVLATTCRADDDPVARLGEHLGLEVVRGPEDNLLQRFALALELHPCPAAVRITADNPLTDPGLVDQVAGLLAQDGLDYAYAAPAPYGLGADAFASAHLRELARTAELPRHREHINTFFLDHHLRFRIGCAAVPPELRRPDVRVTVDTAEDLARMQALFGLLDDPEAAGGAQAIAAYDRLPGRLKAAPDPAAALALARARAGGDPA